MDSVSPASEAFDGELHIEEITFDGTSLPENVGRTQGRTVAEWHDFFATRGYFLKGPSGKRHDVSLEPWADRQDARLRIYVKYVDPKRVGTKDPHGRPHS
jgi:hypothetical protein